MFRVIQSDPETLSIHLNAGAIDAHARSTEIFGFFDAMRTKGVRAPLMDVVHAEDWMLTSFGSSYLHELRHFADLLFTPFGFYRVRAAFEMFINIPKIVFDPHAQIPIPIMSGMDPVTRSVVGVDRSFEASTTYRLCQTAFSRIRWINEENHFDPTTSSMCYGGDRILEALAYLTQFEFLYRECNTAEARGYFRHFFSPITGSAFDDSYRWFTPHVHAMHRGEARPNNMLMKAILFASLCGSIRYRSKVNTGPAKEVPSYDVSNERPSNRYAELSAYFISSPRRSLRDPYEAFQQVDDACRRIFGRHLVAEIEEDIDHAEETADIYSRSRRGAGLPPVLNAAPVFSELVEYRRALLRLFKDDPIVLSTSQGFFERLSGLLKPSVIYHCHGGAAASDRIRFSSITEGWIGLIDRTLAPPVASALFSAPVTVVYAVWSPLPGDNGSSTSMDRSITEVSNRESQLGALKNDVLASRQGLYAILAPLYRWMLYGKRYRGSSEVESDSLPQALGLETERFVIDPVYEDAEDISLPDTFMEFFDREEYFCDVCSTPVTRGASFLVSARTMRQNPAVAQYYDSLDADVAFFFLKRDWSAWLLCREDMLKFGLSIPHRSD